jgi:hypothetical protein
MEEPQHLHRPLIIDLILFLQYPYLRFILLPLKINNVFQGLFDNGDVQKLEECSGYELLAVLIVFPFRLVPPYMQLIAIMY